LFNLVAATFPGALVRDVGVCGEPAGVVAVERDLAFVVRAFPAIVGLSPLAAASGVTDTATFGDLGIVG